MHTKTINSTTLELTEDNKGIGKIIYNNPFSFNATISISDDKYELQLTGLWGTKINLLKDDANIAELKMNWKGDVVIVFADNTIEYAFKALGTWKNRYVLLNDEHTELITLTPKFNLPKFSYEYDLYTDNNACKNSSIPLLALLSIYCANYYIAVATGAIAAL